MKDQPTPQHPPHLDALDQGLDALLINGCLTLSELDGFIVGLAICPDLIAPSEWLSVVFGDGDDDDVSIFESKQQDGALTGLVLQHYQWVVAALADPEQAYQPLIDVLEDDGEALWELWIGGFEAAVMLRPDVWRGLMEGDDEEARAAVSLLITLVGVNSGDCDLSKEELDQLIEAAPDLIPEAVRSLGSRDLSAIQPAPPNEPVRVSKIGRNDPCSCGSGKKYKRCCGANV